MIRALYELDENDKATGTVYFFCSEHCQFAFCSKLADTPIATGWNGDYITGSVCDHCGKPLP